MIIFLYTTYTQYHIVELSDEQDQQILRDHHHRNCQAPNSANTRLVIRILGSAEYLCSY
jgi:hypothetical protein